jgi:cation diffusion facilitator family transporter
MKNFSAIRRVLIITMGLNLVATTIKLVIGYRTGSISLIANGFDSVFDSASNVVGLVGIYLAARPADEEHPYGHRKFETFTAVAIVILLFLTCWELAQSALERLQSPVLVTPVVNMWSFGALLFGTLVHVITSRYELSAGRRLRSDVLVADAVHTRTDVYVSISVIGGLIAVRLGYSLVDPLLALAIAGVIAKVGIDIIRESSKTLLDRVAIPLSDIEAVAQAVPGVQAVHHVRSRGHEDDIHVDLHIQVQPDMPAAQAHAIAHKVQDRLTEDLRGVKDVVIHIEPQRGAHVTEGISGAFRQLAGELELRVHGLRAYELDGGLYADLHVEVPADVTLGEAHRRSSALIAAAHKRFASLHEIVTHIEPAVRGAEAREVDQEETEDIQRIVQQVAADWCESCHKILVRRLQDELSLSLHCQTAPDTPIEEAHQLSQRMESALRIRLPQLGRVVIHMEPAGAEAQHRDPHE